MSGDFIYMLGSTDGRLINLGWTDNPARRLREHRRSVAGHGDWEVLAVIRTDNARAAERTLKNTFDHLKIQGNGTDETFRAGRDLIDYIRWLRRRGFVGIDVNEVKDLPCVDASQWKPDAERIQPEYPHEPTLFDDPQAIWAHLVPPIVDYGGDFYSPKPLVEAARKVMGGIDLDPASEVIANRWIQAGKIYTISEDGLKQPWFGRVYLNPPFGRWALWGPKLLEEWYRDVEQMVVLCSQTALSAQQFRPILDACDALCIETGRSSFWGPNLKEGRSGPHFGTALLYFGKEDFGAIFKQMGSVWIHP
jgi:T5orf172 domain